MCKPEEHVFFTVDKRQPAIGARCLCGLHRWGTAAELRALDEIATLEHMLARPVKGEA